MQNQIRKIVAVLVLLWLCPLSELFAQSLSVESNTLVGTKDQLPFWLWANQLGQYDRNSSTIQNFSFNAFYQQQIGESDFTFEAGMYLDLILSDENDIRFTQLFVDLSWKFLQMQIGAFPEEEIYSGLSTTNGNLAASRNARHHPRIRIGFNRFVPVFVDWFFVNGFYEEGLLNDDRYVEDTHLHRKALYLRFGKPETIQVTGGVEHFVMWGGTHPIYGDLQGWESYLDYVIGRAGDDNALMTDQLNIVGNGYGVYQLQISKAWEKVHTTLYVSHPYDDKSGLRLTNHLDNLWGVHLAFQKENPLIQNIVMEFFNTKNQSGQIHLVKGEDGKNHGHGMDDYFNHGVYRSGATYNQMAMVSPLFAPVIVEDGISKGFESTRFTGFHLGADGYFSDDWGWKGLLTYTNNFGKHDGKRGSTLDPSRKQGSALGELYWQPQGKKFNISASLAVDHGSLYDNGSSTTRLGTMLSFCYLIK